MTSSTAIVWFRRDLRLTDNPALSYALEHHQRIIPLYLHTPADAGEWAEGAASRWWLHHSLSCLQKTLQDRGADLVIRFDASARQALEKICQEISVDAIYWNRLYTPWAIDRDTQLKQHFADSHGIRVNSFNASLLLEPHQVTKADGLPYKVFTAYWKQCRTLSILQAETAAPEDIPYDTGISGQSLESLKLLPDPELAWDSNFYEHWQPGERHATERLSNFLDGSILDYETQRDRPDMDGTSQLSAHLHFGEISPRAIVNRAETLLAESPVKAHASIHRLISEIGWREFAYYVLFHFPDTAAESMNAKFHHFPWQKNPEEMNRWQRGQTGIPIVDAGMRQLWKTGWMHNRVRMIVASFLTKNLLIHWHEGARWFWDTLIDADLASNSLGWQWVAGCGTDAAPYFRIFNPVLQSQKFDPHGHYIRQWVPELASLNNKQIHEPWKHQHNLDYPTPVVDLKETRQRALEIYKSLNSSA